MGRVLPTMTLNGYLSDNNYMLVKIFEYFLTSEYSQSVLFYSDVASLPYIIRESGPDFVKLKDLTITTLKRMCDRYWNTVTVEVAFTSQAISEGKSKTLIRIEIGIVDNGEAFSLSRSVELTDSKINSLDNSLDYFIGG